MVFHLKSAQLLSEPYPLIWLRQVAVANGYYSQASSIRIARIDPQELQTSPATPQKADHRRTHTKTVSVDRVNRNPFRQNIALLTHNFYGVIDKSLSPLPSAIDFQ